jgi:hypothetical protein
MPDLRQLPGSLRRLILLRRTIRDLRERAPQPPDPETLARLNAAWGSDWSADQGYAMAVAAHAGAVDGPILECGSGLTTIIAAIYCRGEVWSLEHHPRWYRRIRSVLWTSGLRKAHVTLAPLIPYDDFDWYDIDGLDLPTSFPLVVCDGPPGRTRGGRVGLVPVMRTSLAAATILLDDAGRAGEQSVADAWVERYGVRVERPSGERYAIVRIGEGG